MRASEKYCHMPLHTNVLIKKIIITFYIFSITTMTSFLHNHVVPICHTFCFKIVQTIVTVSITYDMDNNKC